MKALTRRRAIAACAGMVFSFTLLGCSTTPAASSDGLSNDSAPAEVMVKDMNGDEVIAEGSAAKVLTVNSVATQMVLMVGGEDAAATLGQGFNYGDGSLNKAMYPGLANLKTFTRDDATVENVAALDPSMVVIDVPDTVAALRDAGIPAAYVSVTSPDTIKQAVQIIGDALGGEAKAKAAAYVADYDAVLASVQAKSANLSDADKPRVLYLRNETRTVGAGSMPDNWITSVGGINVGAELGAKGGAGSDVTTEAVLSSDPDIIVCENADLLNAIMTGEQYAEMTAVKNNRVYQVPLGTAVWSMGTAEAMLQVQWAATVINPDLYADIDVDRETRDFFKSYYGYDLTQAELDTIFHR